MGGAFDVFFFVLLATLKASVYTATLRRPAVQRLRRRPSTKNTIFPSPLRIAIRPPPADTKLPRHSPQRASFSAA